MVNLRVTFIILLCLLRFLSAGDRSSLTPDVRPGGGIGLVPNASDEGGSAALRLRLQLVKDVVLRWGSAGPPTPGLRAHGESKPWPGVAPNDGV